ncbi:hypothetical protein [uncultured Megasphaera sp.]|uniref:hypothetical protein n=1 Tax=uncultured Megasphaera sp. TaxID=165188 RepID=UPI00261B6F49|nr:hypothetical protein [uncultured Megasphaera sp.]
MKDTKYSLFRSHAWCPWLALLCAIGWPLAYPLIKAGYGYIGIGNDLGSKVVFAGIRFFFSGLILLIAGNGRCFPGQPAGAAAGRIS